MRRQLRVRLVLVCAVAITIWAAGAALPHAGAPLAIDAARITISGTSNIHAYAAFTTDVRVTRAELGTAAIGETFWDTALRPGGIDAFEIAIPAATLTSSNEGLDKNMHKALKVRDHPDIVFRLARLETSETAPHMLHVAGVLRIAGVEREVTLDLEAEPRGGALTVRGEAEILMTDYGIVPPRAMLGMLRTHPKVTVHVDARIALPPSADVTNFSHVEEKS